MNEFRSLFLNEIDEYLDKSFHKKRDFMTPCPVELRILVILDCFGLRPRLGKLLQRIFRVLKTMHGGLFTMLITRCLRVILRTELPREFRWIFLFFPSCSSLFYMGFWFWGFCSLGVMILHFVRRIYLFNGRWIILIDKTYFKRLLNFWVILTYWGKIGVGMFTWFQEVDTQDFGDN